MEKMKQKTIKIKGKKVKANIPKSLEDEYLLNALKDLNSQDTIELLRMVSKEKQEIIQKCKEDIDWHWTFNKLHDLEKKMFRIYINLL